MDDRPANVAAAACCAMHGVVFGPHSTVPAPPFAVVASLFASIGLLNETSRSHDRGEAPDGHDHTPPLDLNNHPAIVPVTGADDPPGGILFPVRVDFFTGVRS